ncbi:hypothetical protein WMY93_020277 [Mugilogobius chulae]|uniref:Reverse transcriptase domain-containing protein n=1 Tax=Mugilogobius chulae TaxID=88201 RepID=A0AAW0NMG2_9GOBI
MQNLLHALRHKGGPEQGPEQTVRQKRNVRITPAASARDRASVSELQPPPPAVKDGAPTAAPQQLQQQPSPPPPQRSPPTAVKNGAPTAAPQQPQQQPPPPPPRRSPPPTVKDSAQTAAPQQPPTPPPAKDSAPGPALSSLGPSSQALGLQPKSGFRPHHSTETALIKVTNDIHQNTDAGKVSVLILLDLSAAFDTVDHDILLHRLEDWVGISGCALKWLKSYLEDRKYFVEIGNCVSEHMALTCGVPQGSILGPLLFNLYLLPLGQLIRNNSVCYHNYADNTQIYVSLTAGEYGPVDSLCRCIQQISVWMQNNFLQLNSDKTEVIIFGPQKQRESVSSHFQSLSLKPLGQVRNLGVIMDSDLNFNSHIKSITSAAFYHLKNIAKIKSIVSKPDLERLIHAFVSSRLDYCNGLLTGLSKRAIKQLQYIQNAAARVLTRTRKYDHISPVLRSLHWLPVAQRIDFKTALLVFKSLHGLAPKYISDMLVRYEPSRTLRTSGTGLLLVPRVRTKHGESAFQFYAAKTWNSLPDDKQEERDKRSSRDRPNTLEGLNLQTLFFGQSSSGLSAVTSTLNLLQHLTFCCYFYIEPAATSIYKVHQLNEVHL